MKKHTQNEANKGQNQRNAAFQKRIAQLEQGARSAAHQGLESFSFRTMGIEDTDAATLAAVSRAVKEGKVLRFRYRKVGAKAMEQRSLEPYHVACIDHRWYALGHDRSRRAVRTFVLGRMTEVEVTAEKFTKPRDFDAARYLGSAFRVMGGTEDYEVVVEFDAWATDVMGRRRWHWSQEVTALDEGRSRLRLRVGCLEEVERWVLGWGTHARVVEPVELRVRLRRSALELFARYGGLAGGEVVISE